MFGYDANTEQTILRDLIGMHLFCEILQVLTPAEKTFLKTSTAEVDVIETIHVTCLNLASGIWSKFLSLKNRTLCHGTRQLWSV